MEVKVGSLGVLEIYHKTKFGKLADVFAIGNNLRVSRGEDELTINDFLRQQSAWKYIAELDKIIEKEENLNQGNSPISKSNTLEYNFDEYTDSKGRLRYSQLVKMFPNVIQSKRGKQGGTWCHLELLIKAAMYLDARLEAEVIHTFVTQNILEYRDQGGDMFKKLNKMIDTLPDRSPLLKPNGNKGCYINVAKIIREKIEIESTQGYNGKEHDIDVQKRRTQIEDRLVALIEMGYVTSYKELKIAIVKA